VWFDSVVEILLLHSGAGSLLAHEVIFGKATAVLGSQIFWRVPGPRRQDKAFPGGLSTKTHHD